MLVLVTWSAQSTTNSVLLSIGLRSSHDKVCVACRNIRVKVPLMPYESIYFKTKFCLAAFLSSWKDYVSFEGHLKAYEVGYWFATKWLKLLIWLGIMPEEITMEGISFA